MIRKNQPGNFASIKWPPSNPNPVPQATEMMVSSIKYSRTGEAEIPSEKATKARAMDMIRKSTPIIIFFFKRGVVTCGI